MINSSRVESNTYEEWGWVEVPCGGPLPKGNQPPDIPYDPDNPYNPSKCYEYRFIRMKTDSYTVKYPSDGLLPTYAQELKGVDANSGNRYVIDHANHMELKNMSYSKNKNGQPNDGTKNRLNEIFDRPQGDWFRTDKKIP